MPEGEKVLRGQPTAKQVVVGAGGQADAGHVLERKYHGDPVPTEPAENADVSDAAGCVVAYRRSPDVRWSGPVRATPSNNGRRPRAPRLPGSRWSVPGA